MARRWRDAAPEVPPGEDEVIFARRLIAQRCLYGVDRNPMAVDLAKVSLWLATLAKEHALTFVDHALRHGDSLVGLSQRQIETFHWDTTSKYSQQGFETIPVREQVAKVSELRRQIREADASVPDWDLRDWWDEARFELDKVRLFGDLATAAFFEGSKPKEREAKRAEYAAAVIEGRADQFRGELDERRRDDPPLAPFHWELEFPEVFEREPSAGSAPASPLAREVAGVRCDRRESAVRRQELAGRRERRGLSRLVEAAPRGKPRQRRPRCPFLPPRVQPRPPAGRLRPDRHQHHRPGRHSGLRWICKHGGEIFSVRRRVKWPGLAAVVVSVLHIGKGWWRRQADRRPRRRAHHGVPVPPRRPRRSRAAQGQRRQELPVGSYVLGMGFTFDDTDTKGVASPLAEMHRLIEKDPRNQNVIFPYIGGQEVNTSPTQHHRYQLQTFRCGGRVSKPAEQVCPKTAGYRPMNSLSR